jgi:hypothetical protein
MAKSHQAAIDAFIRRAGLPAAGRVVRPRAAHTHDAGRVRNTITAINSRNVTFWRIGRGS